MYESLQDAMDNLASQLERLFLRERLYQSEPSVQLKLCLCHIGMLKFWYFVYSLCTKTKYWGLGKLAAKSKIKAILERLSKDMNELIKKTDDIEIRLNNTNRNANARDRLMSWTAGKPGYHLEYHKESSESLVEGSGAWLLQNVHFKQWEEGALVPPLLWLHSDAGWGKSFLCSSTINWLKLSRQNAAIAYLFLSMSENTQTTQLLRDLSKQLLHQLFQRQPEYTSHSLLSFTNTNNDDPERLEQFFEKLVQELQPVYVLLDGLDEARERVTSLTNFLIKLTAKQGSLRLWCSSQNLGWIRSLLKDFHKLPVAKGSNGSDIETYLLRELNINFPSFESETRHSIVKKIIRKADGNFLLARNTIESLSPYDSKEATEATISAVPRSSFDYYRKIFERLKSDDNSRGDTM